MKVKSENISESEDEDDFVNTDLKDRKCWLVKVPKFVSDKWKSANSFNDFGRLRIYKNNDLNGNPRVELILPDTIDAIDTAADTPATANNDNIIPKKYKINMTNMATKNQYIFTQDSKGHAVAIIGKIEHEATASPIIDADYKKIMQSRTKQATDLQNGRQAQILNGRDRGLIATAGNQWDAGSRFMARGIEKKRFVEKKERLGRDDLLDLIFSIFETKKFVGLKELLEKTNQPLVWLKQVLGDVCDLYRKGPNSGSYGLKVEYQSKETEEPINL